MDFAVFGLVPPDKGHIVAIEEAALSPVNNVEPWCPFIYPELKTLIRRCVTSEHRGHPRQQVLASMITNTDVFVDGGNVDSTDEVCLIDSAAELALIAGGPISLEVAWVFDEIGSVIEELGERRIPGGPGADRV